MSDYAGKPSRTDSAHAAATTVAASPGKRPLVEQAYVPATPVQLQTAERRTDETDNAVVHTAAARGTATPASELPHVDWIQRAFGRHDISSVQAHVGSEAATSASDMGAQAYATGNHVVLGKGADLFTEAHEAAHVVQQRGGIQLKGGVGEEGDPHERHADAVASLVVQGKSAEGLLDQVAGPAVARPAGAEVQPQIQRQPSPAQSPADKAAKDLQQALDDGRWKESIRPRMYKQLSAPAIQRAKDRRKGGAGAPADLTGLGAIANIDHFAKAVKTMQSAWAPPTTPDQRATKLFDAANVELRNAKVPALKGFAMVDMLPRGQFDPKSWSLELQKSMIENSTLSNNDAADLCNTTLHEARHAEQHWLAARWDASQGKLAAEIVTRHGIHGDVAIKAVHDQLARQKAKKPWDNAVEEALGHEMFDAFVTNKVASHQPADDVKNTISALEAAHLDGGAKLAVLKTSATQQTIADAITATAALRKDIKDVEDAYTRYRAVPFDRDTHEVADAAELAFRNLP